MLHPKQRFRKTAILMPQGLQKLEAAKLKARPCNSPTQALTLEVLSEHTGLSPHTLSKVHAGKVSVDLRTLERYFSAFNLTLEPTDYCEPARSERLPSLAIQYQDELIDSMPSLKGGVIVEVPTRPTIVSWGTAPDVSAFCGRRAELATLKHWILDQHCRLVTLVGMGGIGKTWLATKLAEQMQQEFKIVIWRSLQPMSRSHPSLPFNYFLDDLICHLSSHPAPSEPTAAKFRHLADLLSRCQCLLIIDNIESVLQKRTLFSVSAKSCGGDADSDDEAYRNLLKHFAIGRHQSCVVLTSRVEPQLTSCMSGMPLSNRSLVIRGLPVAEIQQIVGAREKFQGTTADWDRLVNYYNGNPQILSMVASTIQHLFDGSITDFLQHNALIFDDLRELLDQQLEEVSDREQEVMNVLASQDAPLSFSGLQQHISPAFSTTDLLESLKSLNARSLIEQTTAHFSLSSMLGNYARERWVKNSKTLAC